jgi:methylase of polypeptide subunit release factors
METELASLAEKQTRLHALLANPRAERPFFLWHFWFRHVFSEKGGFDIVIANPPYIRADNPDVLAQRKAIQAEHNGSEPKYRTLWERWDLYIAFIERGYQLLRDSGIECMMCLQRLLPFEIRDQISTVFPQKCIVTTTRFSWRTTDFRCRRS